MKRISVIDSHTGGEPTRLVVDGFPDLGTGSMAERKALLSSRYDDWRAATVLEPRGNDVIVGALLCEPVSRDAAAGVIFFNNTGYLNMCGHGTIGLVVTLAHMGRIGPGEHTIETPVGDVTATLHADGTVSVRNVPAYRYRKQVPLDVPGFGRVHGDVAWGGNWFFLVNDHGQRIALDNAALLTDYTTRMRLALTAHGISGAEGAEIDHIELFAPDPQGADSRNFVLCPGNAYDRSPCGTGTSAKLACLAADGKLLPGRVWTQASVIGSTFLASYEHADGDTDVRASVHSIVGDGTAAEAAPRIIPTLRGTAYVCAEATLLIDDADPFAWGIRAV
jgi:4-hydroxyproline epimerase